MKIKSIEPMFDTVLVEPLSAQTVTKSGIVIPESSQQKPNVAKVIQLGSECKSKVKVGDYIVIPKNISITTNLEVEGKNCSVIKEENIIAIVEVEDVE